ncbi:DNA topoisomerase 2 [Balamuthia mandrillaris]
MSDESDFDFSEVDDDSGDDWGGSPAPVKKAAAKPTTKAVAKTTAAAPTKRRAPAKAKATSSVSASALAKKAKTATANYDASRPSLAPPECPPEEDTEAWMAYQRMSPHDHILIRPDTYVGSVERTEATMWVYDDGQGMTLRPISYVPGLYKIFDEILVNAADNYQRDKSMSEIRVTIDAEKNTIEVWNDGEGIPVEMHKKEDMYVPELIFGHLLTSSNYDDEKEKVTGGRNGYGAKLANIFSTKFSIETVDSKRKKKFYMEWTDNMRTKGKQKITTISASKDYTKVTFTPDLEKFGMTEFDEDTVSLLTKRVYDVAGCNSKLKVKLNGKLLKISSFEKYVDLYFQGEKLPHIFEKNDRWEVCVSVSKDSEFRQVSFVNSICTTQGGSHVKYIVDKLVKQLIPAIKKKAKVSTIKPAQVKAHLWVFINCLIVNPAFNSQTKDTLTSQPKSFGSTCDLSENFIKQVVNKTAIATYTGEFAKMKENQELQKKGGSKKTRIAGITKLDDANEAGGRNADKCTLILTEGDSAKTLAVAGLSVVGRNRYGVFPLKGKPLNVRDATHKQVVSNVEFTNIKQILGLKHGADYSSGTKGLRYGKLMIMADQDHDGSHIKGLVINFLHYYWPSLLKIPGFVTEFITPIVKATNGKQVISFFTQTEYESWKQANNNAKNWKIKYYKGLGTSTPVEGKQYFKAINRHKIDFKWVNEEDGDMIELAFSKSRVNDRKTWLSNFKLGTCLDSNVSQIRYADFINKELIHFSIADCARSIPCFVDGLKPGQRKILFACFLRNLRKEMKVAQLTGYVGSVSAYHHGEESLAKTIVGMAQNFCGSNNINLLVPAGSFGSRLQGGKDAASPRYIHTLLCDITRKIFHPDDDNLLEYLDDDGFSIEPRFYVPIIPMVLINGADGIGTGWSSFVPNYNPRDVITNIQRLIRGQEMQTMHPWYRGFEGIITEDIANKTPRYKNTGIFRRPDPETLEIVELPIGMWTQKYKKFLEELRSGTKKHPDPVIKDFDEHHTHKKVHFVIYLLPETAKKLTTNDDIEKFFKLSDYLSINNMHLFDEQLKIRRWDTAAELMQDFYEIRLDYYERRKKFMENLLERKLSKLDNQVRFILAVVEERLVVNKRKKAELLAQLEKEGYDKFSNDDELGTNAWKRRKKQAKKKERSEDDEEDEEEEKKNKKKDKKKTENGYDYLLSMKLWNLTMEKVEELIAQRDKKKEELEELKRTGVTTLWERDLQALMESYEAFEQAWEEEEEEELGDGSKNNRRRRKPAAAPRKRAVSATKKAKGKDLMDDEEDDDDFTDDSWKYNENVAPNKKTTTTAAAKATTTTTRKKQGTLDGVLQKKTTATTTTATKKATIGRAAAAAKKTISLVDEKDEDEDDDDMEEEKKVTGMTSKKRQLAPKQAASSTVKMEIADEEEEEAEDKDEDEEFLSLADRILKKKSGGAASTKTTTTKKKASVFDSLSDLDSSDDEDSKPVVVAPKRGAAAAKKQATTSKTTAKTTVARPAKRKAAATNDADDGESSSSTSTTAGRGAKKAKITDFMQSAASKRKAAPPKKEEIEEEEEEDDEEEEEEEEEEEVKITKRKPAAGRARGGGAAKATTTTTAKTTAKTTGRPARRAAAAASTKKTYVPSDSEEEEEEKEEEAEEGNATETDGSFTFGSDGEEEEEDDGSDWEE